MDSKSLAKSKRAHTQHHTKKSHSVHKPKGSQGSDKSRNPQNQTTTSLQSNWDRYDDEEELDPQVSTVDAIIPKSKGADYLHLLSEAQAESQSKTVDSSSSLDDLLHDEFSRGVGSMISVRGESILSWMEDDNFVVEEENSSFDHEPGFLSLNLNALAKTLEKVDLHERLYIDADLLPPEMYTSQANVNREDEQTRDAEAVITRLNEPLQQEESSSLDQVKVIPILTDQSEISSAVEPDLDLLLSSFSASNQNISSLQNSAAFETELDSILNSKSGPATFNKPSKPEFQTAGFEDILDDLLETTSVSTKQQPEQTSSSFTTTAGKSKVLQDFDSWLDTI